MKLVRALLRLIVIIVFSIIAHDLSAETFSPYRSTPRAVQTSLNCNTFTFDATKSQLPESSDISFLWDCGDGVISTDPIVTQTYHRSGEYNVHLSITDHAGFECSTAVTSRAVRVNIPPHASFMSEDNACINEPITFDANTSYAEIEKDLIYTWNFGDGEIHRGAAWVKKAYKHGGDYKVLLTVDDQSGTYCNSHTTEKMIHINAPPVADAGGNIILRCSDDPENMIIHFDEIGRAHV